jgi:hypothetical protein
LETLILPMERPKTGELYLIKYENYEKLLVVTSYVAPICKYCQGTVAL